MTRTGVRGTNSADESRAALPQLLGMDETAKALGVCTKTLRQLVTRRGLPCVRIGRLVKFDACDVFRWLEARKEA